MTVSKNSSTFESEYWRTLWHLLWRPGYIIADYLNGYRRNYLRPFELLIATTIMLSVVIMIVPAELSKQESLEKIYQEHVVEGDDKEEINYLTLVIVFMDYQQLFGRKWYSTLWRTLLCVIW